MQTENPSGARLNALQIYFITSLLFVFGTIIEFAFVLALKRTCGGEGPMSGGTMESKTNSQIIAMSLGDGKIPNVEKVSETEQEVQEHQ